MASKSKKNRNQQRRENKNNKMNKTTKKTNKIKEIFKFKGNFKERLKNKSTVFSQKLNDLGVNKKIIAAVSFSLLMFVVGSVAFIDYISENEVKGANLIEGEALSASIVAQNNPIVVFTTNINESSSVGDSSAKVNSAEIQLNTVGKLPFNPAIFALVSVEKEKNEPKEGDFVEVSLAPSIKNIQKDLTEVQLFDSKRDVYEMIIDGKIVACFDNPDDARLVVDTIIESSTDHSAELLNVEYKEDFEIKKTKKSFLSIDEYSTVDDAVAYLLTGTKEKHIYSVVAGDIPESIAEEHGMTIDELYAANPSLIDNGYLLQIGQELALEVPVPMLTVVTTERKEYNDSIDFETTEEENPEMYEGETRVKVAGVKGKRQVIAQVTKENGLEVSRELVSEEVLSEPVGEVLIVGTKPAPPRKGTGTFAIPLARGTFVRTSEFGYRWGRLHRGLDMACPTGSPIYASDGGVVVESGWGGSYGYVVVIDHGGNFQTRYAHCSALYVSEGENVFQGQHIADVGSTGNSTGPHVHFEVMQNGTHVNPAPYIFE